MSQSRIKDKFNSSPNVRNKGVPIAKNIRVSEAVINKPVIIEGKVASPNYFGSQLGSVQSIGKPHDDRRLSINSIGHLDTPISRSRASSVLSIQKTQKIVKINFVVDQINGPFYKIQDAIDEAKDGTIIKVDTGLYSENLVIKDKSIVLEAKDYSSEVYVLGKKGPTLLIDAEHSKPSTIQNLKFTHKGSLNKRFLQNAKKLSGNVLKDNKFNILTNIESYHLQFERLNFDEKNDTVVYVKKGQLIFKKNKINLNLLTRESQLVTPAILIDTGTTVNIESCDLRGSQYFHTLGIAMRGANVLIKDTLVTKFRSGGIMMYVKPDNNVMVFKSYITNNKFFGIQVLGNSSSPTIQMCEIENNTAVGIQICTSSKCKLSKNKIALNRNGVEVICSDPTISDNKIERNFENGIMVKCLENKVSIPIVKGNDISSNRFNGILCFGMGNKTKISKNLIHFNKKSGVVAQKSASIVIIDNDIHKNIFQGILLVENSFGHIESNKVHENIKANIAFGGEESCNTTIINNKIYQGRCEGIFMIDCGAAIISRNEITNNYDGIVSVTGVASIINNSISDNKNHGVMLLKDSRPIVKQNKIRKNKGVGIFIRDKSRVFALDNEIGGNDIGIIQERKIKKKKKKKVDPKNAIALAKEEQEFDDMVGEWTPQDYFMKNLNRVERELTPKEYVLIFNFLGRGSGTSGI